MATGFGAGPTAGSTAGIGLGGISGALGQAAEAIGARYKALEADAQQSFAGLTVTATESAQKITQAHTKATSHIKTGLSGLDRIWQQQASKILNGQETLGQGITNAWNGTVNSVAQSITRMTSLFSGAGATQAASARAQATSNAAVAATGAAKSAAELPMGWLIAPAAAAATFAMAAGYVARIFSAEGGFDVPAGLNPMTQLHAREMVLPAPYADVIRGLAANGGGSGGGFSPAVTMNINGRLSASEFEDHSATLINMLQNAHRNGAFG